MAERTAGIRQLNQHAGALVREVNRTGEPLTITDRGVPVARLVTANAQPTSMWDLLQQRGKVTAATRELADVAPADWDGPHTPSEVLADLRGDH